MDVLGSLIKAMSSPESLIFSVRVQPSPSLPFQDRRAPGPDYLIGDRSDVSL